MSCISLHDSFRGHIANKANYRSEEHEAIVLTEFKLKTHITNKTVS